MTAENVIPLREPPEDGPPEPPPAAPPDEPCPVTPLGTRGGQYYFLTPLGQFRAIAASRLNNLGEVAGLFEHRGDWLWAHMPRKNQEGEVTGWNGGKARDFLIAQCSIAGLFEPGDRVREQGCWDAGQDRLIVHLGDRLLPVEAKPYAMGRDPVAAGQVLGPHVYPATAPRDAPAMEDAYATMAAFPDGSRENAGERVLADLMRWNFKRGQKDAVLVLGWMGCGFYGGALSWRPAMWIGAKAGAGKTTLRQYIEACLGDAMVVVTDTTAAALRQMLARQSRAVLVDELENDPNKAMQLQDVVKIIRLSSTRGQGGIARGSAEQVATISHIDAVFLAISIRRPPLLPQDAQRIARIELEPLGDRQTAARGQVEKAIAAARDLRGPLFGRMLAQWAWYRHLRALGRMKLIEAGRSARFADQYGALYAAAALLLARSIEGAIGALGSMLADAPEEDLADQDQEADEAECLKHLLAAEVETWKSGERRQVGELVKQVLAANPAHDDNRALRRMGLAVMYGRDAETKHLKWLAVANQHPVLQKVFEGTPWAGKAGASSPWTQSLKRFTGTIAGQLVSFGSVKSRALLILDAYVLEHLGDHDGRSDQDRQMDEGLRT